MTPPLVSIARHALGQSRSAGAMTALLYAFNVAGALAAALLFVWRLRRHFPTYPPLDVLSWIAAVRRDAHVGIDLALCLAAYLAFYALLSTWLNAVLLARLSGQRWRPALGRPAFRLLVFRVSLDLCRLLTLAGWASSSYGLQRLTASRWALEAWLVPLHLLIALPFVLLLLLLGLVLHYGQPLLIAHRIGPWRALWRATGVVRHRKATAGGLWLIYWVALLTATGAALCLQVGSFAPLVTSTASQLAIAIKAFCTIWAWCCALALAPPPTARPARNAPAGRTPRSGAAPPHD